MAYLDGCECLDISGMEAGLLKYQETENESVIPDKSWIKIASLNYPRAKHGAFAAKGKIFVFGGFGLDGKLVP